MSQARIPGARFRIGGYTLKSKIKTRLGCGAALVLLAVSFWAANQMLANWWAAGGPPTPEPAQSAFREQGNLFFWIMCAGFLSAIGVGLWSWLHIKQAAASSGAQPSSGRLSGE